MFKLFFQIETIITTEKQIIIKPLYKQKAAMTLNKLVFLINSSQNNNKTIANPKFLLLKDEDNPVETCN
jgi:hypothetical protein